jgi:tripartite-type tricarboxylate transporter receptor subunit TctC
VRITAKPGAVGRIMWSYFTAATVQGYTLTKHQAGGWTMDGHVADANPFNLTQRPLVFHVPHKKGVWHWPVVSVTIQDRYLVARLGDPLL